MGIWLRDNPLSEYIRREVLLDVQPYRRESSYIGFNIRLVSDVCLGRSDRRLPAHKSQPKFFEPGTQIWMTGMRRNVDPQCRDS